MGGKVWDLSKMFHVERFVHTKMSAQMCTAFLRNLHDGQVLLLFPS